MTCFCGCLCELHNGITCFFLEVRKKMCQMACLLLSFGAATNRFALFFGDSVIFFLCDLTCFNFFEFILTKKKNPGKIWFCNSQMDQSKNTTSLWNSVQYLTNTENQIYSTLSICSTAIYPSAITMTKSLWYHHRMTIHQNTWKTENLS